MMGLRSYVRGLLLCCAALSGSALSHVSLSAREWVDDTGYYRVEAEYVKLVGPKVHLRRADGLVIAVSLNRLSEEDLKLVRKLASQPASNSVVPPAAAVDSATASGESKPTGVAPDAIAAASDFQPGNESSASEETKPSMVTEPPVELAVIVPPVIEAPPEKPVVLNGPVEAIRGVTSALENHQPRAVWDALPASYQEELHRLLHDAARQIDPELWQAGVRVLRKSILTIHHQRTFLREHPVVQQAWLPVAGEESQANSLTGSTAATEDHEASWDAWIAALVLLAKSDLADQDRLAQIDLGTYLDTTGVKLMGELSAASAHSSDDAFNQTLKLLAEMEVTLVSNTENDATVRLQWGEERAENLMVCVEGKWIPADLAIYWSLWMAQARSGLRELTSDSLAQAQLRQVFKATEQHLDQLLAAETQAEFNLHLIGLLNTLNGSQAIVQRKPR